MIRKFTDNLHLSGGIITIILIVVLVSVFDLSSLKETVASAGIWAPLVIILAKVMTIIIAPLSGAAVYPLAGIFFGFSKGFLYVILGDFIGYSGAFLLSRVFGRPFIERMISQNEKGMLSTIVEHVSTTKGFLHMCMTCFALPELISYGTGLSKLPYWKFISILWPASSIAAGILVFIGSYIGDSNSSFAVSTIGLMIVGTIMLSGVWFFVRHVKQKHHLLHVDDGSVDKQ